MNFLNFTLGAYWLLFQEININYFFQYLINVYMLKIVNFILLIFYFICTNLLWYLKFYYKFFRFFCILKIALRMYPGANNYIFPFSFLRRITEPYYNIFIYFIKTYLNKFSIHKKQHFKSRLEKLSLYYLKSMFKFIKYLTEIAIDFLEIVII